MKLCINHFKYLKYLYKEIEIFIIIILKNLIFNNKYKVNKL